MKTNKDIYTFSPVEAKCSPKSLSVSIDITDTGMQMGRTNYIMRYPRLDTVLMVERFIQKHDGELKKKQLWSKLPRKMMYQTFCVAIDYLLYSGKISLDDEGKIGWIFYPAKVKQDLKLKRLFWKRPPRTVS